MTSSPLFLLILLMRVGHFLDIFTSIFTHGTFKEILHQKMKVLSSYTHPHVVSNLYEFLSSAEQKGRYLEECQYKMQMEFENIDH